MPARMLLTLVLAAAAAPSRRAQPPRDPFAPDAVTEAARAEIAAELSGLAAHPWAGRYQRSNGMGGAGLELAPRAGFVYDVASCLDTSWMHGSVTEQELKVVLKQAAGTSPEERPPADLVLLPVAWGERHYLLFESEVHFFCDAVAANLEDETASLYFLKEGDEGRPSSGPPRTLNGGLACERPGARRD